MSRRGTIAPILVAVLLLAACGGGSGDTTMEPPPPPPPPPPDPAVTLNVTRVFASLTDFTSPVAMVQAPGDSNRWFVVEQAGRILVFQNNATVSTRNVFLDIRDRVDGGGEMGLLGMAFHPAFPTDPRVFVSYTNTDSGRVSRISSFEVESGLDELDPDSEVIMLVIDQPESNHNGGGLIFGPDGFLYIGSGDGGGGNDQHGTIGNAQRLTILLGKMLRIDVDGTTGSFNYRIPADNPHAGNALCGDGGTGVADCPELYAWGLRNPWRWSFDRVDGQLWVADVGQSAREEINRVTRGGNYGWRCREGTRETGNACGPLPNPLAPVAEYGRTLGSSITGGYVYRGTAISGLAGRYVFGDFGSGRIWHIAGDTQPTLTVTGGFESGLSISSFAEGADGELYVIAYGGQLYRLAGS